MNKSIYSIKCSNSVFKKITSVLFLITLSIAQKADAQSCAITWYNNSFCAGAVNRLCGPATASGYLWSTGETTQCITLPGAGNYTLTITNANGSTSSCNKQMPLGVPISCGITNNNANCASSISELCAPAGMTGYLWSTGSTNQCISVTASDFYNVAINNASGCNLRCVAVVNCTQQPLTCQGKEKKVPLCHYTGSASNPFHQICISSNAVQAHLKHNELDYVGYCTTRLEDAMITMGAFVVSAYPNPVKDKFTLEFNAKTNERYVLQLADVSGRTLLINEGTVEEGPVKLDLPVNGIAPGIYCVKITAGEESTLLRIMISR